MAYGTSTNVYESIKQIFIHQLQYFFEKCLPKCFSLKLRTAPSSHGVDSTLLCLLDLPGSPFTALDFLCLVLNSLEHFPDV